MSKVLNIGVIGVGGRGRLAWLAHKPEEGVFIVGGADIYQHMIDVFKEKFGQEVFVTTDYRVLLEKKDIDAVFVTSPDFMHEEHAVAALEAGKDVYLEKPMAITIEGCDRILKTAYRNKRKLYVGHNMRHSREIRKMKEIIEAGKIGEVKAGWCRHFVGFGGDAYFKDWHAERNNVTSLLLQKGVHDIDVLHWLCGGYSRRVTAVGGLTLYDKVTDRHDPSERGDTSSTDIWPPLSQKGLNPVIDVEDISMMLMVLDNGGFASYQQCHYTPDTWRNYTIIGTEGRIENFGSDLVRLWNKRYPYNPWGDESYFLPAGFGGHGGSDTSIVNEFIDYIRKGNKITTSAISARNSVAAGCCGATSLRNGNIPIDIPPVEQEILEYFNSDVKATISGI